MSAEHLQQDPKLPEGSSGVRIGRELQRATAPFAVESVAKSWWHVGSTFVLLFVALIGAGLVPWWPVRLLLSVLAALLMVRCFITYHDYMHGAILSRSRLARVFFPSLFGACAYTAAILEEEP